MFLVSSEIFGLLVNALTADDEYSRHNMENVPLPIQMQLSKTPKTFYCNFLEFLESRLSFEHFEKKNEPLGYKIPKLLTPKDVVT